jgi:hypothetical protein
MGLMDLISGGQNGQGGLGGVVNRFVNPTNPLGQFAKALTQASGGGIGDALTLMDQQKRQQQQEAMQQQMQEAQLAAMTAKQNRAQGVSLGNGGYGAFDPDAGTFNVLRQPDPEKPHNTALQENFAYYMSLPPEQQKLLRPMMSGFANTEDGQQMAVSRASSIANAQGQARAKYRAVPGGFAKPSAAVAPAAPQAVSTAALLAALGKK